ncbi:MAG: hypothetical protein UV98_C0034G0002 [Parcubacteria group bacterium GW2011_GWB1_43_6]|nr:MAG: hypothetical protein UV98_C0034G0002 [Parcubacteria group bacterium GW2011_GWB1_43_6]
MFENSAPHGKADNSRDFSGYGQPKTHFFFAFASAYADEATRRRAEEASPLGFLVKPVRSEQLRELLGLVAR